MQEALKGEKDLIVTNSIGHIESLANLELYLKLHPVAVPFF